jgi:hypothetical protein
MSVLVTDAARIKRYLLGELSNDEHARLDEECERDGETREFVEQVEETLIADYLSERLDAKSRVSFERSYLGSAHNREKVEIARRLGVGAGKVPRVGRRSRTFRLGGLLALVIAVLLNVWLFNYAKHRRERLAAAAPASGVGTGAGAASSKPTFTTSSSASSASSASSGSSASSASLGSAGSAGSSGSAGSAGSAEAALATSPSPAGSAGSPGSAGAPSAFGSVAATGERIVQWSLAPLQAGATSAPPRTPTLVLLSHTEILALALQGAAGSAALAAPQVRVQAADGSELWRGEAFGARQRGDGVVARVEVPTARLGSGGDLAVILFDTHNGIEEARGRYLLRVSR